jgi:hypothetical protein
LLVVRLSLRSRDVQTGAIRKQPIQEEAKRIAEAMLASFRKGQERPSVIFLPKYG